MALARAAAALRAAGGGGGVRGAGRPRWAQVRRGAAGRDTGNWGRRGRDVRGGRGKGKGSASHVRRAGRVTSLCGGFPARGRWGRGGGVVS